jgi:hypothetical protein
VNAFHEHDPALSRTRPKRVARAGYLTNARWSRSGSSECFARIVPDLCMYVCPVEYIAALGFPAVESSRAWPAHRPREDGLTHPADTSKDPILLLPWLCFEAFQTLSTWRRAADDVPPERFLRHDSRLPARSPPCPCPSSV